MTCTLLEVTHLLGRKWAIPVLEEIAQEKFDGFNRFRKRAEGMTPKVLAQKLDELAALGLIEKVENTKEPNVAKYKITEKGEDLHKLIIDMKAWSIKWGDNLEQCATTSCTVCGNL